MWLWIRVTLARQCPDSDVVPRGFGQARGFVNAVMAVVVDAIPATAFMGK